MAEFFCVFVRLVGKHIALRLFPVIAASLNSKYEAIQKEMDDVYMGAIRQLPSKYNTLVNTSQTYSTFFKMFRNELEEYLTHII